jgi:uncharacterized membrane protein YhaH (DUF805 family)
MNRQPFIVGPTADKVLGFLAGVLAQVLGVLATVVVMFLWAGSEPTPEVQERRTHAAEVSGWSGVGCLIPVILFVLAFLALGASVLHGGATVPNEVPFPEFTFFP